MGDSECKRTRKPINFAEIGDVNFGEEDFDDFKTSSKDKREKTKDRTEKLNGEERKDKRERKHEKDKLREHKDRDRHKRDGDKQRERNSKERDERMVDHRPRHEKKRKEHEEKRHRSERRDDDGIDSGRNEGNSDSKYDSSDSQRTHDSQGSNKTTTSPIVSPSRRNPKPRLSIEEKVFQRELQAVLELSKADCIEESANTPEAGEQAVKEEGTALDTTQCTQAASSPKSLHGYSGRGACSPPIQGTVAPGEAFSSSPNEAGTPEGVKVVVKLPVLPSSPSPAPVSPTPQTTTVRSSDVMEPQPSTSTGLGLKRARKTLSFKEDSNSSDGFDGFNYDNSADSDASEGSDFVLSPKKKKKSKDSKKTVKTSNTTKNSLCKSSSKTTDKNKAAHQMSSPPIHLGSTKENSVPKCLTTSPSPQANTVASPRVSIAPEPKLPPGSSLPKTPPTKASTAKGTAGGARPVRKPLVNTSSPSSGTSSIGLVKTQFRNPLTTSPGSAHSINSLATSVRARSLIHRGTGLRLGLSRRASIKPLHPSVAGKITD